MLLERDVGVTHEVLSLVTDFTKHVSTRDQVLTIICCDIHLPDVTEHRIASQKDPSKSTLCARGRSRGQNRLVPM